MSFITLLSYLRPYWQQCLQLKLMVHLHTITNPLKSNLMGKKYLVFHCITLLLTGRNF
jgi:hypothetical protein